MAMGNVWTWPHCPSRSHRASYPLLVAPRMSIRGATKAPWQHLWPPTLYSAWGAPGTRQRCWCCLVPRPHHLHATPATSHLSPFSHASVLGQLRAKGRSRRQAERQTHTTASGSLSAVAAGPVGRLIFGT